MGMMTKLLAACAVASAMAGGLAQASTITSTGITGNPNCTAVGFAANTKGTIDVNAGASFNADFVNADNAGNFCFNMKNSSLTTAVVTLAVATVNQGTAANFGWGFVGGVKLVSAQLGTLWTVQQGAFASNSFKFQLAAGQEIFFDWIYGNPYTTAGLATPKINFAVFAVPVPIPAAGFLLIAALGGLAALRRRKSVA